MLVGTHCVACTFSCLKYTNNNCQACKSGSYLLEIRCISCVLNCVTCKDNSSCEACTCDYSCNSQTKKCQSSQSSIGNILIIMISIQVSLILLAFIIICVYQWSKNNRKEQANQKICGLVNRFNIKYQKDKNQKINLCVAQQCPICLQLDCKTLTSCKYIFHLKCLLSWKNVKKIALHADKSITLLERFAKKCQIKILKLQNSLKKYLIQQSVRNVAHQACQVTFQNC